MKRVKTSKYLFLGIALLSLFNITVKAQEYKGIAFQQKLSWSQIKAKAKVENKFIFVDVYATWCGPCKEMDRVVYTSPDLGSYMNDKFISVKVQTDSTDADSEFVKAWYRDSKHILADYNISGYPSFLFFLPHGQLIHRGLGFKSLADFKELISEVLNPDNRYFALLEDYKNGKKNYRIMPGLIKMAEELKQQKIVEEISKVYYENYLSTLSDDSLFTKAHLSFIGSHLNLLNYDQRLFRLILHNPDKANELMDSKDYSQQVISIVVNRDELYQKLWKPEGQWIAYTENPNWKEMHQRIKKKYGVQYANILVPAAQLLFYQQSHNWTEYVNYVEKTIRENPPLASGNQFLKAVGNPRGGDYDNWGLNDVAWNVFLNTTNPILLKAALQWSELSIKLAWCDLSLSQLSDTRSSNLHQYLDTKANLLYKLGKTKEAIECEEKAIEIMQKGTDGGSEKEKHYLKAYKSIIEKIKNSEPTWPVKKSI